MQHLVPVIPHSLPKHRRHSSPAQAVRWGILGMTVLSVSLSSGCNNAPPQASSTEGALPERYPLHHCKVEKVFDGDTFACDLNGNHTIERPNEHIRMLGIDTPETRHSKRNPSGKDQPFAMAAKAYLGQRIEGSTVTLVLDWQEHDPYGRTLAYVYQRDSLSEGKTHPPAETLLQDHTTLNEQLLQQGLATLLFYEPNTTLKHRFNQAQFQAQQNQKGLWSQFKTR